MPLSSLHSLGLGLVQGLTEFLPVSSSGHLALYSALMEIPADAASFLAIWVHGATLLAVLLYYRKDLLQYAQTVVGINRGDTTPSSDGVTPVDGATPGSWSEIGMLIVSTIPAMAVGLPLKSHFEELFGSTTWVAVFLVVTGLILSLSLRWRGGTRDRMTWRDAALIGCAQAFAILPGISRSGTTIMAALLLGVSPKAAVRWSFLMSIPAIGGGFLLSLLDGMPENVSLAPLALSGIAAFVSALAAIGAVAWLVREGRFWLFSPYCWAVAAWVLIAL